MPRFYSHWYEFDGISNETVWKLVDTLFQQKSMLLIGAVVFAALGLIGYAGTESAWYLLGPAYAGCTCALRLYQTCTYARASRCGTPDTWVWRSLAGS